MPRNLFDLPHPLPDDEDIIQLGGTKEVRIERIVSNGQTTPAGEWYDQEQDEWVALIQGQAVIVYGNGEELQLTAGDHVILPARCRHRVAYTSAHPPCIWIAVFGNLL